MKKLAISRIFSVILCMAFLGLWACSSDSEDPTPEVAKTLSVDQKIVYFQSKESVGNLKITSTVSSWAVSNSDASWIELSQISGKGTETITIKAKENKETTARTATVTVSSNEAASVVITVNQAAFVPEVSLFPDYNTNPLPADESGMSSTAVQIASQIGMGWNIGNTLEATGGETAWGNPKVTKELINLVKANGFSAIRIPCSWNQNMSNPATAEISKVWLDRVKEVTQYCVDNNMYVIINIHWDGGWLENNVTTVKKVENNAKQKAFWQQIATHLRGFDEHVLFASANEPNVENASQMAVLNSYHQTFIDAVRATGGKNAFRTLIVQGPSTDIEKTNKLMTTLPTDTTPNRMMAEIHFYPYQFTLMTKDETWGKMFYYWGEGNDSTTDTQRNATSGEEADIDKLFKSMKTQFVDKGIPVVLGEFGAIKRDLTGDALTLHLKSRADFLKYVVKSSKTNGLLPFYWDAGNLGTNTMSLFDRKNNTIYDLQALTALQDGLK